jgi:hypothetical protein
MRIRLRVDRGKIPISLAAIGRELQSGHVQKQKLVFLEWPPNSLDSASTHYGGPHSPAIRLQQSVTAAS